MKTKSTASLLLLSFIIWMLSFTTVNSQEIHNQLPVKVQDNNPIAEITNQQQIMHALLTQPVPGSNILMRIADFKPAKKTLGPESQFKTQGDFLYQLLYKADTVISYSIGDGTVKQLITYNDFGKVASSITLHLNGNTWANTDQQLKTYDFYGNLLTDLVQVWENGNWLNSSLTTFTYNGEGKLLTSFLKFWDNNNWSNLALDTYTYDGSGNMLTALGQIWDNSGWLNNTLETATYNGNGEILTDTQQNWESNAWKNSMQYIYYYDPSGLSMTITRKSWDNTAWLNQSLETYTYNAGGNIINYQVQLWDLTSWQNSYKLTNTYNSSGKILTTLEQSWDSGSWLNMDTFTYTYDGNGNLLTSLYQTWNGNWVNYSLIEYSYDNTNNWDNINYLLWNGSAWADNQIVEYYYYQGQVIANSFYWNGTGWEVADWMVTVSINKSGTQQSLFVGYVFKAEVYYSSIITGLNDPEQKDMGQFLVSPNPVVGEMNIETQLSKQVWASFQLFDLSGKYVALVFEGMIPADKSSFKVAVNGIHPGLYLLKMKTSDSSEQQRVCIIK
jgi:hypothetical protein